MYLFLRLHHYYSNIQELLQTRIVKHAFEINEIENMLFVNKSITCFGKLCVFEFQSCLYVVNDYHLHQRGPPDE